MHGLTYDGREDVFIWTMYAQTLEVVMGEEMEPFVFAISRKRQQKKWRKVRACLSLSLFSSEESPLAPSFVNPLTSPSRLHVLP